MANIYYEKDADLNLLKTKQVAIVGYGSQGHAHALNLRDSGVNVVVACYPGSPSAERAAGEGLRVASVEDATKQSDIVMVLIPDHVQKKVYLHSIAPHLRGGQTLMFAHGFNVHFGAVVPPDNVDVSMIAPKGPGHRVRELYVERVGVPSLLAVHQDATGSAKQNALAYAGALGACKAGVIETTFKEETESDLFGEQSVLCGGVTSLVKASFETLVNAGYQPEIAYFECLHELKLIVDLIYQGGLGYMRYSVSDTAEYGDYTRGPKVIDEHVRETMQKILADIQSGKFAKEWLDENDAGRPNYNRMQSEDADHAIEVVGKRLRDMMSFLQRPSSAKEARSETQTVAKSGER